MAIELEDKTNVTAPNADYPYGDIKDNDGSSNGTPVNRNTYADFHQFFARLLDQSGTVANGLLDNATNGFQYFESLVSVIRGTTASETQSGTVERATASETNAGTDSTRYVTPLRLKGYVDDPTRLPSASTTSKGVSEIATQAEVNAGTDNTRYVTPLTLKNKSVPSWVNLTLSATASVYNGDTPQYRIFEDQERIEIRGSVISGPEGQGSILSAGAIPLEYRPTITVIAFSVGQPDDFVDSQNIGLLNDGGMSQLNGGSTRLSLHGVSWSKLQ